MKSILALSRLIDAATNRIGHAVYWLVLVAVLISSGNAVVRYIFSVSSNGWLELQWYLFSMIFLFSSGYALLHNQHVRVDVISGRFSPRIRAWIDIFGTIFFLMPMAIGIMYLSWPVFIDALQRQEVSSNAGGLIVWPARLMVPIGFFLLVMQGVSELIKRIAFLQGLISDPSEKDDGPTAEELLIEEIRKQKGEAA